MPEVKYQSEGGPSLQQCFALLREASSAPVIDLQRLLDAVIFNFLIGNHDAHGKNFSLLYEQGSTRLSPLYDVLSTVYYPELTKKMAMKIGGEYVSGRVLPKHFEQLAEEAGLAKPLVNQRVLELAEKTMGELDAVSIEHSVAHKVAGIVRGQCDRILGLHEKKDRTYP